MRTPKLFILLAVLLLVGSLAAAGWYFFTPRKPADRPLTVADLDVVCSGRVDTPKMVISLDPAQAGRVAEVLASEGSEVSEGQEIVKLDDAQAVHRRRQAEAAVAAATIDRDRAAREARQFPRQIELRRMMVRAAGEQVTAAKKNLEARQALSGVQKPGEAEVAAMEAAVRQLEEMKKAEDLQLAEVEKADADKYPELAVRAAQARLDAATADLDLAKKAEAECTIRAPARGYVLRLQAVKGGGIAPGYTPAIVFAPAGKLVVRAEVDQEFLGRVKEGQPAEVRDDSRLDSPVWAGRVVSVSRWVAQRRTLILEPGEINDVRTLEVVVEPDSDTGLVIGERMRITIKTK